MRVNHATPELPLGGGSYPERTHLLYCAHSRVTCQGRMTIDTKALSGETERTKPRNPRPRMGRPTREEAKRRQENLLEVALDMFLERGFDETTVEDIATAARMSK